MKNLKRLMFYLGCCLALVPSSLWAQCIPSTSAQINVNHVNATLQNGSDMFWDLLGSPRYEVPAGSGKHVAFASALWLGGMDDLGVLHVTAATYRQQGNDFYAGPFRSNGNYNCATGFDQKWQKIWKVSRPEVQQFQSDYFAGTVNFANYPDIETWPGNGDTTETEAWSLAPFVDRDGDGVYDPAGDGDYPCFPGDQGLWWVNNDDGPHTESNSNGFPVQVTTLAYAFDCNGGFCPDSVFDNITFYHREITNFSSSNYSGVYIGNWLDTDVGYYADDYIGCDTIRNLSFGFNGDLDDDLPSGYGLNPPAVGCLLLPNAVVDQMATSMYYENDFSVHGNPETPEQYYNYMRGIWKNGSHLVDNGLNGQPASGTGPSTNFAYPGDAGFCGGSGSGWSESSAGNAPFDRRLLQAYGPYTLPAGAKISIDYAIIYSRGYYNDNLGSVCELKSAADVILGYWGSNQGNSCSLSLPTGFAQSSKELVQLEVFPNPSKGIFNISWTQKFKGNVHLELLDLQGRLLKQIPVSNGQHSLELNATEFASGLYFLRIGDEKSTVSKKIVIQE